MLQSTVKRSDINLFVGLNVTNIQVGEFVISLFFGHDKQIQITTHWELVDTRTNTLIDRALSVKLREQFHLLKLFGVRLRSFVKTPYFTEIVFDNDLKLIVY